MRGSMAFLVLLLWSGVASAIDCDNTEQKKISDKIGAEKDRIELFCKSAHTNLIRLYARYKEEITTNGCVGPKEEIAAWRVGVDGFIAEEKAALAKCRN